MSLIFTPPGRLRKFMALSPLYCLILLLLCGGWVLWSCWPQILFASIQLQKVLHQQMAALLQQVSSQPQQAGVMLVGFSLLYGVLHALGPGHGKIIITTFLATHPTKLKTSIKLTLAAAIVQGGGAILLVTGILVIFNLSSRQLHLSSYWLEKGSYLVIVILGIWLCIRAVRKTYHQFVFQKTNSFRAFTPLTHQHSEHCGCGHQHVPDQASLEQAVGLKAKLMVVLAMGMRPCSGAIMMLLFSKVAGVYWWGIVAALAMAAGTAITVSAMGILVHFSRQLAVKLASSHAISQRKGFGWPMLSFIAGILLIGAGVILWCSAQPEVGNGIRPLFLR
ncbi:MAG: hypothetical protein XXXJIFNMEKO3_02044 [Candidatus Erwinia impunctatus]|nr:hypothetical protein XXXJIFNMEKO_02044 [Culicoides impunctatus]